MARISDKIVGPYVPDEAAILKAIKPVVESLSAAAKALKLSASPKIGGSLAKGTLLKGDYDVDIFMVFIRKHKDENISELLAKIIKRAKLKPERLHGSRDYFALVLKSIRIEIVPVLKSKDSTEAINVTDMSPLHVDWVKKRITVALANDIRAAKLFCKSKRIYGAESYISGFSGHVLDILVLKHGGFERLLKAAAKWKAPVVVDPSNTYRGKALLMMNQSKIGPLVVIDPIDSTRNAAAAVSEASLNAFISASKKYLKNPGPKQFEPYVFSVESLMKKGKLILVMSSVAKGKIDIVGARIMKEHERVRKELDKAGFKLLDDGWHWDKGDTSAQWFRTDGKLLALTRLHEGPFINQKDNCQAFKKKYPKAKTQKGRLYTQVKNRYRKPEELVKAFFKDSEADIYVHES